MYQTCKEYLDSLEEGNKAIIQDCLNIVRQRRKLIDFTNEAVLDWCLYKYGGTKQIALLDALRNCI